MHTNITVFRLFITTLALSLSLPSFSLGNDQQDNGNVIINPIEVVESDPELREVYEAQIDTEFFELGFYTGLLSIEDFGSGSVNGLKASFHATEDFFLQANMGKAEAGLSSQERFNVGSNQLLNRDYEYYNLLVGYNLFPGEAFLSQHLAFNTAFYVVAGAGNTDLNSDSHFTFTMGSGYRIILKDWLTWNMDFRDHSFETAVSGPSKRTHNLEFTMGLTGFF